MLCFVAVCALRQGSAQGCGPFAGPAAAVSRTGDCKPIGSDRLLLAVTARDNKRAEETV